MVNFYNNLLTYIDFLAVCASANDFALMINVIIVFCLLVR
jgi:hypothetical protein